MIDLNSDKIDNPEDNTQENEEVENSSIKKRVIIGAGIVALLIAGCVGGYAGYNYKQACSEHNQQVEVLYSKASDSVAAFKADPGLLTFEQRLDTIKNAQNNKEILNKEISNDSFKYADGTSPDWTKLLNKYDSIIKDCRNAQNDEWTTSVTDHVNFDVNSTEDTDSLSNSILIASMVFLMIFLIKIIRSLFLKMPKRIRRSSLIKSMNRLVVIKLVLMM